MTDEELEAAAYRLYRADSIAGVPMEPGFRDHYLELAREQKS